MTPAQHRRVRDVFEAALDRGHALHGGDPLDGRDHAGTPGGRDEWLRDVGAWVRDTTADDPVVADEVFSLLRHHEAAGAFLSQAIGGDVTDAFDAAPALSVGTVVGAYTVVRELGRGGMGHVYLARDTRLGRDVALKALPADVTADDTARARLRREAQVAASLAHPGICAVFALEESAHGLFIVSEFIEGESLRVLIDRGERLRADEASRMARELAEALGTAHSHGIVHRDVKPENVMRARDGRYKLLDFGLARVSRSEAHGAHLTRAGLVVGTPGYMAPEQLTGGIVSPATDVFALGVVLYECLAGRHPFDAPTPMDMSARSLADQAASLSVHRPDLPRGLVEAIDRCLARDPSRRWPNGTALAAALVTPVGASAQIASGSALTIWWRRHQYAAIALYATASATTWTLKEWAHGVATWAFVVVSVAAIVGAVVRGHVLFTERVNRTAFASERRRAMRWTRAIDGVVALGLVVAAAAAWSRPLVATLVAGLGVGLSLARYLVEPTTLRGAFDDVETGGV